MKEYCLKARARVAAALGVVDTKLVNNEWGRRLEVAITQMGSRCLGDRTLYAFLYAFDCRHTYPAICKAFSDDLLIEIDEDALRRLARNALAKLREEAPSAPEMAPWLTDYRKAHPEAAE